MRTIVPIRAEYPLVLVVLLLGACTHDGKSDGGTDLGLTGAPDFGPVPPCDPNDAGPGWDASWFDGAHVDPDASLEGLSCNEVTLVGCAVGFPDASVQPGCAPLYSGHALGDGDHVTVTRLGCVGGGGPPAVIVGFGQPPSDAAFACFPSSITAEVPGAPPTFTSGSVLVQRSGGAVSVYGGGAAMLPLLDDYDGVPLTITAMENWKTQTYHVILDDPRF